MSRGEISSGKARLALPSKLSLSLSLVYGCFLAASRDQGLIVSNENMSGFLRSFDRNRWVFDEMKGRRRGDPVKYAPSDDPSPRNPTANDSVKNRLADETHSRAQTLRCASAKSGLIIPASRADQARTEHEIPPTRLPAAKREIRTR